MLALTAELIADLAGLAFRAGRRSCVVNDVVGLLLLVRYRELKAFPSPKFPRTPAPGPGAPRAKLPRRGDEDHFVAQRVGSRLEEQRRVENHPSPGRGDPAADLAEDFRVNPAV